jgi:hypothetical protein
MPAARPANLSGSLDIVQLSDTQWRVTDHVRATEDFHTLCYLVAEGTHVAVMWLRPRRPASEHRNFDDAMRAVRHAALPVHAQKHD